MSISAIRWTGRRRRRPVPGNRSWNSWRKRRNEMPSKTATCSRCPTPQPWLACGPGAARPQRRATTTPDPCGAALPRRGEVRAEDQLVRAQADPDEALGRLREGAPGQAEHRQAVAVRCWRSSPCSRPPRTSPRSATKNLIDWKNVLLEAGLSPTSVKEVNIAAARSFFAWAVDNQKLARNPVEGVKVFVPKISRRAKGARSSPRKSA